MADDSLSPTRDSIEIPSSLRIPVAETEDCVPVTRRQWERLRQRVSNLSDPAEWASGAMWAAAGVGASALLTLVPWLAAYAQLPDAAKMTFNWVAPFLALTILFSIAVFLLAAKFGSSLRSARKYNAAQIIEDMDGIAEPFRRQAAFPPPDATPSVPAKTSE